MPKRKAHRTLAEEPTAPANNALDIDPEQPDRGDSSEGSSGDDNAQAIEHYIDTGKGQLRKADVPVLGPEYTGSHISRKSLFNGMEVSDDDPFLSDRSRQGGSSHASDSDDYADLVDLDGKGVGKADKIDSNETLGDDDEEESSSYAFRRSKSGQEAAREQHTRSGTIDIQGMDEDSGGFSDMESDILETSREVDNIDGSRNGVDGTTQESEDSVDGNGDLDMEDMGSLSSEDEESQPMASSSSHSPVFSPADADRAALREIIADSQKVMTSNLSKAAKFDVAKGRAIKQQRTAFDYLLNTRIRLQKALVATNSLQDAGLDSGDPTCPAVDAAEEAALKLWSTLDSLRQTLESNDSLRKSASTPSTQTDPATSISNLWTRMQAHERQTRPQRLSTLDKWSSKTSPISTLPRTNKFAAAPTQPPLSAVLEQQLTFDTSLDKLVAKTQIPRSCAPLQAAAAVSSSKSTGDHAISSSYSETIPIYDDADFYSLLLRDLLEQRSSDSQPTSNPIPGVASATIPGIKDPALRILKKRVDTKASKGRKIRYTVHEKVQNFMAPDDRGRWGEKQREELFKGLLGMKVLREDDKSMNGDVTEEEERAEEGLRLFRS
ncbi:MAG: hypothetical protein LQ349_006200 [Xanthoria aureola]|nr:MAG: hypothetical protein LQ349_006200 [Xanthoria aureola]